jgi:GT2 family glycosyltransferase
MKFSLIICTYSRAKSLKRLLKSVQNQILYPDEILIVDGSDDSETETMLTENSYERLTYFQVDAENRGLTKQRNFGISKLSDDSDILCFLDDDIVLQPDYFDKLISTFIQYPDAKGVGGAIINADVWKKKSENKRIEFANYYYKDWVRKLGSRNILRKRLGLLSKELPGIMPSFSHGFTIGFYPPTGEIHKVEYFMGGVSAYRKELFDKIKFSDYFEGYGLYEDMDFCLRASKTGQLYLNTGAQVCHLHEESGRPDDFKYGKMVVENGWIVWKIKNPDPDIQSIFKWNLITLLLATIRLKNALLDNERGAFKDALGRFIAWIKLGFLKPPCY